MKWTPYAPILSGFYWVKYVGLFGGKEYVSVAKVYTSHNKKIINMVYFDDGDISTDSANITHYSDIPIPFPEEL